MATIIAGRFDTQARADEAQEALALTGFDRSEYGSFYLGPPGQHAQHPIGGDAHHDEGTKHSGATAAAGGALGGAAGWVDFDPRVPRRLLDPADAANPGPL